VSLKPASLKPVSLKIEAILNFLDTQGIPYSFKGDKNALVERFSSLKNYKPGAFTWIKNESMLQYVSPDMAQLVALAFVQEGLNLEGLDVGIANTITSSQSRKAFFDTIEKFFHVDEARVPVGPMTYISPNVKLGENVCIGANCTIDGDVSIGDDTVIGNGVVVINRATIGKRCTIQSGCVIGHDGFGWTENDAHEKKMIKHYGGVEIGDDVHIGANTVVSRGVLDDTTIKNGVKISSVCHISHNVTIGENAVLIAGSVMYGSSAVGKNGYVASAIIRNHCSIGENTMAGMGAVVTKSFPADMVVVGNPAKPL